MKAHPMVARIEEAELTPAHGYIRRIAEGLVEASGPAGMLGELCEIEGVPEPDVSNPRPILAELAAVSEDKVVLVPLDQHGRVAPNARVVRRGTGNRVPVGDGFAGRAVDALGRPIDGGGEIVPGGHVPLTGAVPAPMERVTPERALLSGIRAIDGLLTLGVGQRVGIFAASGVGKTSLIEQIAAQAECDHCILCLVGERGREVEAIWRAVSSHSDPRRYTVVAATSDESAALRARCANYALSLAEFWRARGRHVLLIVDSVTRMAMALREIGLAAGAPPTVRAYTPNVFAALPRLVERCGALRSGGAISAVMTVLSETDDVDDPIVELMKSLLDGHIILSRSLAEQGHFPAIDVTRSVSRGSDRLVAAEQVKVARQLTAMLAAYEEARVLIETGVYKTGSNPLVDRSIAGREGLNSFLRQDRGDRAAFGETVEAMAALARATHNG